MCSGCEFSIMVAANIYGIMLTRFLPIMLSLQVSDSIYKLEEVNDETNLATGLHYRGCV